LKSSSSSSSSTIKSSSQSNITIIISSTIVAAVLLIFGIYFFYRYKKRNPKNIVAILPVSADIEEGKDAEGKDGNQLKPIELPLFPNNKDIISLFKLYMLLPFMKEKIS
jgi:hypothetical protein